MSQGDLFSEVCEGLGRIKRIRIPSATCRRVWREAIVEQELSRRLIGMQ